MEGFKLAQVGKAGLAALVLGLSGFGLLCYGLLRDRHTALVPAPDLEQPLPVISAAGGMSSGSRSLDYAAALERRPEAALPRGNARSAALERRPEAALPRAPEVSIARAPSAPARATPAFLDSREAGARTYEKFLRTLERSQASPIHGSGEIPPKNISGNSSGAISSPRQSRSMFGKYNIFSSGAAIAFPGAKFKPVKPEQSQRAMSAVAVTAPSFARTPLASMPVQESLRAVEPALPRGTGRDMARGVNSAGPGMDNPVVRPPGSGAPSLEETPAQLAPTSFSTHRDLADQAGGIHEMAGVLMLAALVFLLLGSAMIFAVPGAGAILLGLGVALIIVAQSLSAMARQMDKTVEGASSYNGQGSDAIFRS